MKGFVNTGRKNVQCLHCRKVLRNGDAGMKHPGAYGGVTLVWHRECLQKLLDEAPLSQSEAHEKWEEIRTTRLDGLLLSD